MRLEPEKPCPCGTGKTYGECCWDKAFTWERSESGAITQKNPINSTTAHIIGLLKQLAELKKGAPLAPGDQLYGDVDPESIYRAKLAALQRAGADPAHIYAFKKTGFVVTDENERFITEADVAVWEDAVDEYNSRHG